MVNTITRPDTFDNIIGQENAKATLIHKVNAFKKTNVPPGHVALFGPAGLGKTTLAKAFAQSMGVGFKYVMATGLSNFKQLRDIIDSLETNDVLFLDEIHSLNKDSQEKMYDILEDFTYDRINPITNEIDKIPVRKFTCVAATTHQGKLNAAFLRRFLTQINLTPYSKDEMVRLIESTIQKNYGFNLDKSVVDMLASISHNRAGKAIANIKSFLEVVESVTTGMISSKDANIHNLMQNLKLNDIDPLIGSDSLSRRYLNILYNEIKPVGSMTIVRTLQEQSETIENVVEPFLLNDYRTSFKDKEGVVHHINGSLIKIGARGREITEAGKNFILFCKKLQEKNQGWFNNERFYV